MADEALSSLELLEEYVIDGRRSLLYRVTYQCQTFVLSRSNCLKLQQIVRDNIVKIFNIELR